MGSYARGEGRGLCFTHPHSSPLASPTADGLPQQAYTTSSPSSMQRLINLTQP